MSEHFTLQFFASAEDPAQLARDKELLEAFRVLPVEYQERITARLRAAAQDYKDWGDP